MSTANPGRHDAPANPGTPGTGRHDAPSSVNELVEKYLKHAETWYRHLPDRDGARTPTGEHKNRASTLRFLRAVVGDRDPRSLTAEDLYDVQDHILQQRKKNGEPLSRGYIDRCIKHARQMFTWARKPPRRWVPAEVLLDLSLVEPLPYGRTDARETEEVEGVPEADYRATLAAIAEIGQKRSRSMWALQLSVMLDLQWHTGMRPGELVSLHRDDLSIESTPATLFEPSQEVMVYRPLQHKGRHHRLIRHIFFGPEGRRIIEDWLPRARPDGRFWKYTTVGGYRSALQTVQSTHGLASWTPNQIRHSFGTRMREASGLDIVQVLMGHKHRSTTEIYAKPDMLAAIMALLRHG